MDPFLFIYCVYFILYKIKNFGPRLLIYTFNDYLFGFIHFTY